MRLTAAGRWLGLGLGLLLLAGPLAAAAQDVCRGREGCLPGDPTLAGRDSEGRRLRVLRASLPSPLDEVGGQVCTAGLDEYWLQRGGEAPVLFGRVCANVGISEGIAVTIGDNRIGIAFAGPGGQQQQSYATEYQLSPARLRSVQLCDARYGDHPRFTQTRIAPDTLQGEALADIGPPRRGDGGELGCYPRRARQMWTVIPRLALDAAALRQAGVRLGGCAARLGPGGGGYMLLGRRPRAEVRLLATGPRDLIVQLDDPDLGAPAMATRRVFLEVSSSYVLRPVETAASERQVSTGRLDPDSGDFTPAAGSTAPAISSWRATGPGGRTLRLFHLQFAPGEFSDQAVSVSVVYGQARRGGDVVRLGSSRVRAGQSSSLGETFDVSTFASCAVRDGALEMVNPGAFEAPFEANEAGGLRILD